MERRFRLFPWFRLLYGLAVPVDVSIIVPAYNEEENILPLSREVAAAMARQSRSYELLFVDDASTDNTWVKIQEARRLDPRIRAVQHTRNSGQSAALWTGLRCSRAPIIATLDADMQNDPGDLPGLLERLQEVDFVSGFREKRKDTVVRKISSVIARWARKTVLRVDVKDTGCAIRAFKREALEGILPFAAFHRFLPVLVHNAGAKILEVPVNHRPRATGISKYGIWNRLGYGVYDLFAVSWYQRRRIPKVQFIEFEEKVEAEKKPDHK